MTTHSAHSRQRGITLMGTLIMLFFMGMVLFLVMKLIPPYIEQYKIKAALDTVAKEGGRSTSDMRKAIYRRLEVDDVTLPKDALTISRDGRSKKIQIKMELRFKLFQNLDAVLSINEVRHPSP